MKVRIESERHSQAKVYLDGQEGKNIRSIRLDVSVDEVNRLYLEHIPEAIQFEGEAQVIAVIDGRRYLLIE
ncbi:hypothetical protein KZ483_24135 [Paenibacillus sp. sptzw28]|uniref:hypothetical protein n=1 Tax=Paenibacillus sp. sptzw28 TaxID=715179 RepID=UPI001C6EA6C7|nr:hypothetical protein [Paenibacillus sp. sptzw28]QYR20812.1 hypothetical protein KZ483_24135 [Paenibacillus sp. sptzw28]